MKWLLSISLVLLGTAAFAESSAFVIAVQKQGEQYISLQDLQSIGFKGFWQENKQRLLLQAKKGHAAFLLLDNPYAEIDGVIVYRPHALIKNKKTLLVSVRFFQENLLPFLTVEQRQSLPSIVFSKNPPAALEEKEATVLEKKSAELPVSEKASLASCVIERPVKKIFIDPGHGGSDLGTSFHGVYEKSVVLNFSKLVAKELAGQGLEISFSRGKDVFLPLDIRSELAREWKADLFISIHMNSSPSKEANGTETYILSQEATDAEARKLALKENSIVKELKSSKPVLKDILWDMEQTSYLQESAYLASFIQKSLVETAHDLLRKKKNMGQWKNRGVRRAPFFVLSRAAMPAVLVELGYLTNDKDRKLLSDKKFQESLAKALAGGVKLYREACKTRQ